MLRSLGGSGTHRPWAAGTSATERRYQHGTRRASVVAMLRVYLGHGASGTAASMAPWVDGLRARGIEAHALELPKRKAEDAVAAYEAQVPDEPGVVVGGHSFGGRVASLAVAGVRVAGAARARVTRTPGSSACPTRCTAPGRPEAAEARSAHWPAIDVPALLLSGTSDPFARIDLLEAAMPTLRRGRSSRIRTWATGSSRCASDALDRIAAFVAGLGPRAGLEGQAQLEMPPALARWPRSARASRACAREVGPRSPPGSGRRRGAGWSHCEVAGVDARDLAQGPADVAPEAAARDPRGLPGRGTGGALARGPAAPRDAAGRGRRASRRRATAGRGRARRLVRRRGEPRSTAFAWSHAVRCAGSRRIAQAALISAIRRSASRRRGDVRVVASGERPVGGRDRRRGRGRAHAEHRVRVALLGHRARMGRGVRGRAVIGHEGMIRRDMPRMSGRG